MKVTIKAVLKALPRFDWLRREYMFPGETGYAHGRGYLASAYADIEEDGSVEITLYAVGDAMERRHYYGETGTFDIITEIVAAIRCESRNFFDYSPKKFRRYIAWQIQHVINGGANGDAEAF